MFGVCFADISALRKSNMITLAINVKSESREAAEEFLRRTRETVTSIVFDSKYCLTRAGSSGPGVDDDSKPLGDDWKIDIHLDITEMELYEDGI
jgi:hypothetical protein